MDKEKLDKLERLDLWCAAMRQPPYDKVSEEISMLALKMYAQKYANREETRKYYRGLPTDVINAIDNNGKIVGDGDTKMKITMFENLVLYE